MNIYSPLNGYEINLLKGALVTVELSLLGLLLALVLGLLVAFAKLSRRAWLRWPATLYTTVIRGIPDLVLLFLFYYGGQMLLNHISDRYGFGYIDMTPFTSGTVTIGVIFSAYMAESFRGAVLSIPKGQIEAAQAYGLSRFHIFWHIIRPQMLRFALPSLGNNWLVLLKTTALVSLIQLNDLVGFANLAAKSQRQPFLFFSAAAIGFLLFTTLSILVLRWLKYRYAAGFSARKET